MWSESGRPESFRRETMNEEDCKEANKGHYSKQKQDLVEEELQRKKLESTSKNNLKRKTAGSNKA